MQLSPGAHLAHYEITTAIGKGGMGEVWRAKDTKLGRDVAIKVLPEEFTKDAERLARFEREARILASLEHSNIASIYEIGAAVVPAGAAVIPTSEARRDLLVADFSPASRDRNDSTVHYLVMQLAAGEDLSERLSRGAIQIDEALKIAKQIAEALEAAHERGVVHRDLKPANIKLGEEGQVKVLDFGLAKAMDSEEADADFSNSPTMVRAATHAGMILGTAAYMSPEQARGKRVDKRADLWAFGVVLYEMLTGRRLFSGDTVSDTLAEVLKGDVDWSLLPAGTPQAIRRLLRRLLERDRSHRLADVADARLEIEEAMRGGAEGPVALAPSRGVSRTIGAAVAVAALFAGALGTWLFVGTRGEGSTEVVSLEITGASFNSISGVAISPDGRTIAYVPYTANANAPLHLRELGEFTSRALPGTEGARAPFFSPDGRSVGYFGQARGLHAVGSGGGTPRKLARTTNVGGGGGWLEDGRIVAAGIEIDGKRWRGLAIIPSEGGTATGLTTPGQRERSHLHPVVAPGGRWIVFTVVTNSGFALDAVSLDGKSRHRVVDTGSSPQFAPGGRLVFYRPGDQTLLAAPFDGDSARITGEAVVMQQDVLRLSGGEGAFAVSGNGTLVYTPTNSSSELTGIYSLVRVDMSGKVSPLVERRDTWAQPRFSHDGKTLLVRQTITPDCMLWTIDLERGTLTRQTFDGDHHSPEWSPDEKELLASVATEGVRELRAKGLGGESPYRTIARANDDIGAGTWSRDGRHIVYELLSSENGGDLYVLDTEGDGKPRPFATSPFDELQAQFSPDGKWIAFVSDESGRSEVYVKPFEGTGAKTQISTEGGTGPRWSHDGRELFFASGERLASVAIEPGEPLRASAPRILFGGKFVWDRPDNFDIAPDGQSFVMVQSSAGDGVTEVLRVTLNWSRELEKRFAK
ncbi:MAG: protein kinase domain-containing protein [Thermoanaerobaculia bacterium]